MHKTPGKQPKTTDTSDYIHFEDQWLYVGTINAPNGPKHEQETFSGLCSWIENIGGQADVTVPKLALYDVWSGTSMRELKRITRAGGESGSGRWGQLHGEYFLAEGSAAKLHAELAKLENKYGQPTFGKDGAELPPLPEKPLPAKLLKNLEQVLAGHSDK